ncbi:MAG TPA: sensor domain-containing diguanylate cyclase [Syntrophales bacterium]|nr:sensor domain-containing diguanylate cyclase [Syntrophales bacterium]
MKRMHSLLKRQIAKRLGDINAMPKGWDALLNDVNATYRQMDLDRNVLESTLEMTSQELLQAHSEMNAVFQAFPDLLFRTDRSGTILDHQTSGVTDLPFLKGKLIGKQIFDLVPENVKNKFREGIKKVKKTSPIVSIDYSIAGQDHKSHFEARMLPLLENQIIIIIRNITDRMHAEETLRASEEKYRSLASTTDSMYLVDRDYRYLFMNEGCLTRFDLPLDKIIGRTYGEFHSEKTTTEFVDIVKHVFETGISITQHEYQSERDGRYFLQTFSPVKDNEGITIAVTVASKDVTERKQAEKALAESEEFYRVLAEKSFAGVYVVQDRKFCFFNSNAVSYTEYTPDELIGMESISLVHPDDREQLRKNTKEMLRGERTSPYEFRIITKGGKIQWFMETVTSIVWDGKRAALGNCMSLAERKRMEEEIRALSITDSLTGLHNRRGFLTLAEQQLKFSDRHKKDMLLIFADIDGLKGINDEMGHEEGDKVLIYVAAILKQTLRSSDVVARIGGDEFAVLAMETTELFPKTIMERLQNYIDKYNKEGNRNYKISVSIGTAHYDPENSCSLNELMSRADKMMYKHKRSKKL